MSGWLDRPAVSFYVTLFLCLITDNEKLQIQEPGCHLSPHKGQERKGIQIKEQEHLGMSELALKKFRMYSNQDVIYHKHCHCYVGSK